MSELKRTPSYTLCHGIRIPKSFPCDCFESGLGYEARPEDCFIVTYPKCGTTWAQHIVWMLQHQGQEMPTGKNINEDVPHLEEVGAEAIAALSTPRFIKTHLPLSLTPYHPDAKYIYIARNPFDCAVSFYYHTQGFAQHYDFANGTFADYFDCFIKGEVDWGDYFDHLLDWHARRTQANLLFLTYENMLADTEAAVKSIANFLGSPYSEYVQDTDVLQRILHHVSFAEMSKEQSRWSSERPNATPFIRKGQVGDWQHHFSQEQAAQLLAVFDRRSQEAGLELLWPELYPVWQAAARQADAPEILDLLQAHLSGQFAEDVRQSLTEAVPRIPHKYVYDAEGSRLFEELTCSDTYYLTRTEDEILRRYAPAIVSQLKDDTALVELGSGSSAKTRYLIDALLAKQGERTLYVPIDISRKFLGESVEILAHDYPNLKILGVAADYYTGLGVLSERIKQPKLVIWLGSDIGHLSFEDAGRLLRNEIRRRLSPDDHLLIGIDLKKSPDELLLAYGCCGEKTDLYNAFARNLLVRVNRELGGNFDVETFQRRCFYDAERGCIVAYLECGRAQRVRVEAIDVELELAPGDRIHTHTSFKYDRADIERLAEAGGFRLAQQWVDDASSFSVNLFSPQES
ncbi:L-histidine N(alpha)-methyltransferase [Candidatus Thiothrix sp. Deng01]|uniref:L-histidine N(Alpha)-methyltransferase n=1 Tax=Candidatus Thiothrix phosphatis TaxID=3112415 RepID=A0ABU6CSU4_9GAMM|nr:L-histidine N(alpha)-methyltransferase [Candidatus Thiothrix sp. Deng01]MEB4589884.1 L-histidine N(alpha)-methyltransferase [Candidatus Thiothrix sp. Deng01]